MNYKEMNSVEIASFFCQNLSDIGVKTTLSGGFCVQIYSYGEYTSMDIDLIDQSIFKNKEIKEKMIELGFEQEGKHFKHPDIAYTVEFPSSPLAIGNELVKDIAEIETEYGVLRILTPTDCVKDRLAGFYHWKDERSLEQAILVSLKNDIDFKNIKEWSKNENELEKYYIFEKSFNNRKTVDTTFSEDLEISKKEQKEVESVYDMRIDDEMAGMSSGESGEAMKSLAERDAVMTTELS